VISQLATGTGNFTRAAEIRAFSGLGFQDVVRLGQFEQARRAAAIDVTGAVAGLREANARQIGFILASSQVLEQDRIRIRVELIAAGFAQLGQAASASLKPEDIEPVSDAALRNQSGATGIRRQLVSERADP
jgi:hypothetical protein